MTFDGKVAVITGGAKGIGFATADILTRRGAKVAIADLDDEAGHAAVEEFRARGGEAAYFKVDVTNEDEVNATIASVVRDLGSIDILVNNAGITGPAAPLWETDLDYVKRLFDVHVFGALYFIRATVPMMVESGYGRIVNVASVAGKEGNAGSGAYSAAKAALIGLTKSLGKELATTGVLANAVTPGVIDTPMVSQATPAHIERLIAKIPMGRRGQPSEVAELIAWLSSDLCTFSTAAVFDVSGGRTTY